MENYKFCESSYLTEDIEEELSVCYNNIYIEDGKLFFLSTTNKVLPYVNRWTNTHPWRPELKIFENEKELSNFIYSKDVTEIELASYGGVEWSGNIGHALLDGLYPTYLAIVKFGRYNDKFTFISDSWDHLNMSKGVIEKFSGYPILELKKEKRKFLIKNLIAGTGRCGNRVMREDYTLYGSKYNGMKLFKKRIRESYNIRSDISTNKSSPNIIIIDNKRYTTKEKDNINKVISYYLDKGYNIEYLLWSNYKTFEEQMKRFEDIDIQVSGPGTGMNYSPFLKDGAVSINLGCIKNIGNKEYNDPFPAYMEQSVGAGQSMITTIFYDRLNYKDIEEVELIKVIDRAIYLIKNSIISKDNHFIDAHIFIEYCKRVKNARQICNHLTGVAHFIEYFINEDPMIMPSIDLIDLPLLRRLKEQYGYKIDYSNSSEETSIYSANINGIHLKIEDLKSSTTPNFVFGELKRDFYGLEKIKLSKDDIVIDIGANVGIFSIYVKKKFGCKVYAFEPVELNYKHLLRNIQLNDLNIDDFELHNVAISSKEGDIIKIGTPRNNTGGSSIYVTGNFISLCKTERLDKYITDECKYLKIDCEGSEYDIIPTILDKLNKFDYIGIEYHRFKGEHVPLVLNKLIKSNFNGLIFSNISKEDEMRERFKDLLSNIKENSINIIEAIYGGKDVTEIIRKEIRDNGLFIHVNNKLFGDPSPGVVKSLNIKYTLDDTYMEKIIKENNIFTIPEV